MKTLPIVIAFDQVNDMEPHLCACFLPHLMDAFDLQRFEEAFHPSDIPRVGSAALQARKIAIGRQVEQELRCDIASIGGHDRVT